MATADVNGKPRPASTQITEPSTMRCTTPVGQAGDDPAPSCQIQAPGFTGQVEIGKMITIKEQD